MATLEMVREVQIPLLAAMLLGGCVTKIARIIRVGSMDAGLGPTGLFPMHLRRPVAMAMSAIELGLGIGLIATAGSMGQGPAATCVRLGTGLLFLVATSALLELQATRPDVGCGCFGDFSHAPVGWRTLARSALLAVAALITIGLGPLHQPRTELAAAGLLGILAVELALIAGLSPELSEALVRLGYSEPCELRLIPADRTLAALRRSKQWRRHAGLITADVPSDVWRELCWRYLVFPGQCGDRDAQIVFGVFLRQRRPAIHAAMIDAASGNVLPWPVQPARLPWPRRFLWRLSQPVGGTAQPGWAGGAGGAGAPGRAGRPGRAGQAGRAGQLRPASQLAAQFGPQHGFLADHDPGLATGRGTDPRQADPEADHWRTRLAEDSEAADSEAADSEEARAAQAAAAARSAAL